MKRLEMHPPGVKSFGDTVDNYPNGYLLDYETLIREFWRPNHPEVLANPEQTYQVTFPGYAVLTMQGRDYKLEFDRAYAAKKGYAETMEGTWG